MLTVKMVDDGKLRPDGRFLNRLSAALAAGRLPNGFLLLGDSPQYLDATVDAAANLLLDGELLDLFSIEPAGKSQQISAESVREVIGRMHLSSRSGGRRVAAIRGADRLHRTAANALLKTLEEPPSDAFFLLSARRSGDVLPTIRSRCQIYHCGHVPPFEHTKEWGSWLDSYGAHVRRCLKSFRTNQLLDAYALLDEFHNILDSLAVDSHENVDDSEEQPEQTVARRVTAELMLADCSLRLAQVAKEISAETVGDGRRKSIVRIGRLMAAVDRSIWLMGKNCPEAAAVESFLLPQI